MGRWPTKKRGIKVRSIPLQQKALFSISQRPGPAILLFCTFDKSELWHWTNWCSGWMDQADIWRQAFGFFDQGSVGWGREKIRRIWLRIVWWEELFAKMKLYEGKRRWEHFFLGLEYAIYICNIQYSWIVFEQWKVSILKRNELIHDWETAISWEQEGDGNVFSAILQDVWSWLQKTVR